MRRTLLLILCLLVSQADAQLPFFKKKPPPEPEGPVVINLQDFDRDIARAVDCIETHEYASLDQERGKATAGDVAAAKEFADTCVRDIAKNYQDPAGFEKSARNSAQIRRPAFEEAYLRAYSPQPPPVSAPPAKSLAPPSRSQPTKANQTPAATSAVGASRDALANKDGKLIPTTAEELADFALEYMPSPERLRTDTRGDSRVDTLARQKAALHVFLDLTRVFRGNPKIVEPAYEPMLAKDAEYRAALSKLQDPILAEAGSAGCEDKACDAYRVLTLASEYRKSDEFRREIAARYLPINLVQIFMEYGDKPFPLPTRAQQQEGREEFLNAAARRAKGMEILKGIGGVILWIGGAALVLVLLYFGAKKDGPTPPPLSKNHGSAAFAKDTDTPASQAAALQGVMLGRSYSPEYGSGRIVPPLAPMFTPPETHTLIVAPTGTGKGTRVIVPTLLRYGGAMLTIDPKGENAAITARARQAIGQKIHIVNPWRQLAREYADLGFPNAATYNPLDVLDRKDPNVVAIAQKLAETISPTIDEKNAFWTGNAANLLAAVFLWLTDQDGLGEEKTLARARSIVSMSRKDFTEKFLTKMMASKAFHSAIAEMVSPLYDLAQESYSGIITTLNEATKFLSDPQVKESTATSSFSMKDLMGGKTTVYLVIPPDRMSTHRTWLRLVLTAAMQTFKQQRLLTPPKARCMFLVDEFPALGTIKDIPKEIATIRGYGLDMTLITQGLEQIEANYGKGDAATILNNCSSKWFCNIGDLTTAKYVSESLGKKTVSVRTEGHSEGVNQNPGGAGSSSGKTTNFSEMGRLLLTPDEVMTLGRNRAIVIRSAAAPLYLQPVDYWDLAQTFAYLRDTYPSLYWNPPLIFDRNPYIPNDKGQTGGGQSGGGHTGGSRAGSGGQKRQAPGSSEAPMTDARARAILEVGPRATPEEIRKAYKRLMGKFHPDREGSTYLAQQINAAKAFLLGE